MGRHVGALAHQEPSDGAHRDPESPLLAQGDPPTGERAWSLAEDFAVTDGRDQLGPVVARTEAEQFGHRRAASDPVDREPDVALEFAEGRGRQVAEDPVDPSGVEPQGTEPLLEFGDIVTPEHGGPTVEEPVAEPAARLDQCGPRLATAHAVDPEPPPVLERLDRRPGPFAELPVLVDARGEAQLSQAQLDIRDGLSLVAESESDLLVGAQRSRPARRRSARATCGPP